MRWNFCSYFEQIADHGNFPAITRFGVLFQTKVFEAQTIIGWATNLFKMANSMHRSVAIYFIIPEVYKWTILNISCYLISATYTKANHHKPKFIKE